MLRIDPIGTKNGVNKAFTLPQTSVAGGPTFVVLNGLLFEQVITAPGMTQYTLTGASLTMGSAPAADDNFQVYIQTNLVSGLVQSLLTGPQDAVNQTFTLVTTPPAGSSVLLYLNGLLLNPVAASPTTNQFVLSSLTCTLGIAPASGDLLVAFVEESQSRAFFRILNMQGSGKQWSIPLSCATSSLNPVLVVFVNGQLQQEVSSSPIALQYSQRIDNCVLIVTLGTSLSAQDDLQVFIIGMSTTAVLVPSLPIYQEMQDELLVLMNEQIDAEEAKMCLNRRWQKILNAWSWSFVKTSSVLTTKAPKTTGTVSVTQDSALVVGANTTFATTDIGAHIKLDNRLYRVQDVQVSSTTQQILLINSPYPGATKSALSYTLYYKDYALDPDIVDVFSMTSAFFTLNELSQVSADEVDGNRSYAGQPSSYIRLGMVSSIYQIELWPVPNARYTIQYIGLSRSALTTKGQIIPDIAEVLLMAAEEMACGIVSSKCAGKAPPDYAGAQFWGEKGAAKHGNYLESLQELKSKDRRKFGQTTQLHQSTPRHTLGYDWGKYQ